MTSRCGSIVGSLTALLTAASLGACGSSAPNNHDEITSLVQQAGKRPASLCAHLTGSLLSRLGGEAECLHQAALSTADPTTHATSIHVSGRTATAVVVDRTGTRTLHLVKQGGTWKVASVG